MLRWWEGIKVLEEIARDASPMTVPQSPQSGIPLVTSVRDLLILTLDERALIMFEHAVEPYSMHRNKLPF